jgi:alpha-L-fucosidase 2
MFVLGLLCALLLNTASSSDPGRPILDLDALPAYFQGVDMVWGWNATGNGPLDPLAPVRWFSSAYVGNGLLGTMVQAVIDGSTNATTALRLDLGRTDIWECQQRMPIGSLTIGFPPSLVSRVDMRLDILRAELTVNLSSSTTTPIASLRISVNADGEGVSATPGVLLAVLSPPSAAVTFAWADDTSGPCPPKNVSTGTLSNSAWGAPVNWTTQTTSTGTFSVARTVYTDSPSQLALVIAVANSQRSPTNASSSLGDALTQVSAAVAATVAGIEAASSAWWLSFWSTTSFFSFDDAGGVPGASRLEQYTHIAGYRYASAARYTMSDLMGPWGPAHATTCIGPWCQLCWDMNQEVMLYLPTPSNRGALLTLPAFRMADIFVQNGSDAWVNRYGSNPPGGAANILWWLAQFHRYALYHGDDARLQATLLPGLRAQLSNSGLQNGTDGLLHVVKCVSPEYPMGPSTDCNYDLSIFRWAAGTAEALAAVFDPSDPLRPTYRDILARLAPYPIDPATGSFMVAKGVPFAVPHRHYSHLLMLYDLGLGDASDDTAARSLDLWWNITCSGPQAHGPDYGGDDECRGFTQAAMAAMSADLNRTSAALGNLTSLLTLVGLSNAMYGEEVYAGHPDEFSPVSESAYSAAASVYAMLLRSRLSGPQAGTAGTVSPVLHLWPAAPFSNATLFRGRAAGALLVSAVRVGGQTQWAAVEADLFADGSGAGLAVPPVSLLVPDWAGVEALTVTSGAPSVVVGAVAGQPGLFSVTGLVRGAAAAFVPQGTPAPAGGVFGVGVAEGRNATEANAWGGRFAFDGEYA